MSLGTLTMSKRELDRAQLMLLVRERRRTQAQVAVQLGLTVRQVERMYRAYKAGGAAALVSKKRGRPSPRRLPEETRTAVLDVVSACYRDFGPTLAHEKLTELHGAAVSVETLRQWMIAAGSWLAPSERRTSPPPPRYRRPCVGELVQIDGCDHEWFEARAPRCVLLVYVDDATSRGHGAPVRAVRVDIQLLRCDARVHHEVRKACGVLQRQGGHLSGQREGAPMRPECDAVHASSISIYSAQTRHRRRGASSVRTRHCKTGS